MMNFNVNGPMSQGQLASIYARDPMQADYDLPPQAKAYVHEQASRMGISHPSQHFATLQQNAINTAAATAQPGIGWAQLEAQKQAAVNAMPSRPSGVEEKLMAATGGATAPILSALERQDAAARGFTQPQYLADKRMGAAGVRGALGQGVKFHNATAQSLESDPRFRQLLQANPEKAGKVFTAVTGDDYTQYQTAQAALNADRIKFHRDLIQKKIASNEWKQQGNTFVSRKLIPNPSGTGEAILSNDYTPLDETEQSWVNPDTMSGAIDPDVFRRNELEARRTSVATDAAKVATLQKPVIPGEPGAPLGQALNTGYDAVVNAFSNPGAVIGSALRESGVADVGSRLANMAINGINTVRPDLNLPYTRVSQDRGQDPRRVRALLQNNPRFQALLKSDPQAAMRLVAAMQNQ